MSACVCILHGCVQLNVDLTILFQAVFHHGHSFRQTCQNLSCIIDFQFSLFSRFSHSVMINLSFMTKWQYTVCSFGLGLCWLRVLVHMSFCFCVFPLAHSQCVFSQQQQLQAQHLSHAAHGPVALPPHPSGLQPPGIPPVTGTGSGLLALGALGSQPHLPVKDEKNHHDLEHRGEKGFI